MHNKVIFANGTLDGNIHEMIDSSLILSFAHAYKSVEVYSLNKRIEAINRLIKTERGEWNILYTGFKSFKRTSFYKDLWGAALDAYVYLFKGDKHSLYFYSYSNQNIRAKEKEDNNGLHYKKSLKLPNDYQQKAIITGQS